MISKGGPVVHDIEVVNDDNDKEHWKHAMASSSKEYRPRISKGRRRRRRRRGKTSGKTFA